LTHTLLYVKWCCMVHHSVSRAGSTRSGTCKSYIHVHPV